MQEIFDQFVKSGNSIYGGSAGAIALGQNLLAIPEEMLGASEEDSKGLGLIPNFSFRCHFKSNDTVAAKICHAVAKKMPNQSVLALPETSGLICFDGEGTVIGKEPVIQFFGVEAMAIRPNTKFSLAIEATQRIGWTQ